MSGESSDPLGTIVGFALIALYLTRRRPPARPPVDLTPRLRRVIPLPSALDKVPDSSATLQRKWPLPAVHELVVPVERWNGGRLPSDGGGVGVRSAGDSGGGKGRVSRFAPKGATRRPRR